MNDAAADPGEPIETAGVDAAADPVPAPWYEAPAEPIAAPVAAPWDDVATAAQPVVSADSAEAPRAEPSAALSPVSSVTAEPTSPPIELAPTSPVTNVSTGVAPSERPRREGPSMAPFLVSGLIGGFFAGIGVALAVLALLGAIHPLNSTGGDAAPTVVAGAPAASAVVAPSPAGSPGSGSPAVGSPAVGSPAVGSPAAASPAASVPPIVAPAVLTPTGLADGQTLGSPTAPVTVEIWEDYQCPYCGQFTKQVEPQLVSNYVESGKVRLVYRDFPFLGEESAWASVAARLAQQQGKFWPYHDYLFANQLGENVGSFAVERLKLIASAVGLDRTTFDAGLQLEAAQQLFSQIQQENSPDATALGITSTPSIVVNGTKLPTNDYQSAASAIDTLLAGGSLPPASVSASPAPATSVPSAAPSVRPSPKKSAAPGKPSPTPR